MGEYGKAVDPLDQFQIGELVVYKPAGVLTRVDGYVWKHNLSEPPELMGYRLSCGITLPADTGTLRRATGEEVNRSA